MSSSSSNNNNNTAITAALLSTTLISLAPNLLLLLFPNINYKKGSFILKIGQCLAAGGLLGDVFLHTLPHTVMDGGSGEEVGMMVLMGFSVFLVMDVIVRSFGDDHHHHGHGHSHANCHAQENGGTKQMNGENTTTTTAAAAAGGGQRFLSSSVLLNLTADALHNFTDGLAIGASYAASSSTLTQTSLYTLLKSHGGLASLSILLHEIPHELGDFAVLVSNGFSRNEAMMAQFGTACAAFAGTIVGLFLGTSVEEHVGHAVLLPFTSGGFVYLACVTILPEVLEEVEEEGKKRSGGVVIKERILQLLAFGLGIAFMCMVSMLENMEGDGDMVGLGHSHGHHHHHGHGHNHGHEHAHHHHHGDDL